jgi:drug/metabolite transporter (DMT)-like permease
VKTVVVVMLAALSAAVGETLLSYGMKRSGAVNIADPSQWLSLVLSVVRNPYITVGVVVLAVFFFLYLAALSWANLSFVLPLTAVSYIFAALLARFVLREEVSLFRWIGTVVIMAGIMLIALKGRQHSPAENPLPHETGKNIAGTTVQKPAVGERSL